MYKLAAYMYKSSYLKADLSVSSEAGVLGVAGVAGVAGLDRASSSDSNPSRIQTLSP